MAGGIGVGARLGLELALGAAGKALSGGAEDTAPGDGCLVHLGLGHVDGSFRPVVTCNTGEGGRGGRGGDEQAGPHFPG